MRKAVLILTGIILMSLFGCSSLQRKLLFYPSHHTSTNGLTPWEKDGRVIGYSRQVQSPETVWLMLHGNAGQAADRTYALPSFSPRDAVFIMEYPGYGARDGRPSYASFNAAAEEAYLQLRKSFPNTPVCVAAESIGTGPACLLAAQSLPPDKIVLIVPFDNLPSVASDHFPFLPVKLILGTTWDNVQALANYKKPVEIFGAKQDQVIRVGHAQALAATVPGARFHLLEGGHNEWANSGTVKIAYP